MPSAPSFTWNRASLSDRENAMFGALLEVFMMSLITQFQVRAGNAQATPEDASVAFRATIEWAQRRFPDLSVGHDVTHS